MNVTQRSWSLADEMLQTSGTDAAAAAVTPFAAEAATRTAQVHDLYTDILQRPAPPTTGTPSKATPTASAPPAPPPRLPATLADTGLNLGNVSEMVLKLLYLHGSLVGQEIAHQVRLVFPVVDEALRFLKDQRCIEVSGADLVGRVSFRFALTELGRLRAREVFEQCRYVGPVPVPLEQYVAQCRRQTVTGVPCNPATLTAAFSEFIIRPELLDEIGPAVCTGRSLFVYGPPGNGKTVLAKGLGRFLNTYGGEIYVPYAIQAENTIITMFDPVLHQTTDEGELVRKGILPRSSMGEASTLMVSDTPSDLRWRRIRRPIIITGGELTLDMLELQKSPTSNFYNAPLHLKSNGGVFLIDDFGRQLVSPRDLLNRWIVPLEDRLDYLTLASGRKFAVPFEQFIVFSTNLEPKDLVDDAFLRRIRHKLRIEPPTREVYTQIFELLSRQRRVPFHPGVVAYAFAEYYDKGRSPKSSDPRDLIDLAEAICRYEEKPFEWTPTLVARACSKLFHQV